MRGRGKKDVPDSKEGRLSVTSGNAQNQGGVVSGIEPKQSGGGGGKVHGRGRGKNRNSNQTSEKQKTDHPPPSDTNDPLSINNDTKKRLDQDILKHERSERRDETRKAEIEKCEEEGKTAENAAKERAKLQEEVDDLTKDSITTLRTIVETVQIHEKYRLRTNDEAIQESRKSFEANKKNLKTDLKKCTAFVKKIKSGAAWSMKPDDISKDVASLNLSRYVEEVVTAILDTKPKVTDIPVLIALSVAMHERYKDFLSNLNTALWSAVNSPPKKGDIEAGKTRRVYVRLLTEFLLTGLLSESKNLMKILAEVTGEKDGNYAVSDAHIVVAFTKQAGHEIFGIPPTSAILARSQIKKEKERSKPSGNDGIVVASEKLLQTGMELLDEMDHALAVRAVEASVTDEALAHCMGAYKFLSESLVQSHLSLQNIERRCEQDRIVLGNLTEAREKGLMEARKLKESLLKCVESLSDVLDQPMPHLAEKEEKKNSDGPAIEVLTAGGEGENTDLGLFDDEETRAFYCDIPDYLTTIPPALLGLTPETIEIKKKENAAKFGSDVGTEITDDAAAIQDDDGPMEEAGESLATDMYTSDAAACNEDNDGDEDDKETPRYKLTVLLDQELPESHGREQIDDISERFCSNHGSSKSSRKRLAKALFQVPHARLDLLPFYSRMAATVDRIWPDITAPLLVDLEQQFHGQAKFKKNQNVESRMRTARYIGELTKFRVAPPIIFLRCMRRCLDDFTGNNVDIACSLMESCGRFLFKLKPTSTKVTGLMEAMNRLGKAKNLDERQGSLIKAAFYSVKPPQNGARRQRKEYPPLESYLRYLLLEKLEPTDAQISEVVKQLMRFPWNDPAARCGQLVSRIMLKACRKGRYKTIEAVAAVVASLRRRGAVEVSIRVVDSVIEELRWALEHPNFRDQQRTITYTRLLGELFCRAQVSGKLILEQLYEFINLGHEIPPALMEASKNFKEAGQSARDLESKLPQTIAEDEEIGDGELESGHRVEPQEPVAVSEFSKYDPRVPSEVDPPPAAYRIKLVCTLLEVSSRSLVNKANLSALQGFLTALQRYLFTKPILPTEVEFSLLDTFDAIDSLWKTAKPSGSSDNGDGGFIRYSSWVEAHNATVALEEAEAIEAAKKRSDLDAIAVADSSKSLEDIMTRMIDQNLDEDSVSHMDDEEEEASLTCSAKGSLPSHAEESISENEEDDPSGEEGDDNDDVGMDSENEDLGSEEDAFDEEAYTRQLEEEAFERELRRITLDALEKGKSSARKVVASDMISGSQVVKKKDPINLPKSDGEQVKVPSLFSSKKSGVSVQLLRKGNKGKVEAKEIVVPTETNLAIAATRKDAAAARERDEIKLRVLQYEADSAEAELTGGNVYLEQEKLQVIRNKPLLMDDIDKNFGTTRGDLQQGQVKSKSQMATIRKGVPPSRGGPERGRGGARQSRSPGGRSLV